MANTSFATTGKLGVKLLETSTTQLFALGETVDGNGGTEWEYVQADGAISANYVVFIDEAGQAVQLSTSNDARGDKVGVAGVAFADNEYGWICRKGAINVQVSASCAANARVNTTATAGQLDDDGTTGAFQIDGLVLTTARGGSAGTAAGMLNYPVVGAVLP